MISELVQTLLFIAFFSSPPPSSFLFSFHRKSFDRANIKFLRGMSYIKEKSLQTVYINVYIYIYISTFAPARFLASSGNELMPRLTYYFYFLTTPLSDSKSLLLPSRNSIKTFNVNRKRPISISPSFFLNSFYKYIKTYLDLPRSLSNF